MAAPDRDLGRGLEPPQALSSEAGIVFGQVLVNGSDKAAHPDSSSSLPYFRHKAERDAGQLVLPIPMTVGEVINVPPHPNRLLEPQRTLEEARPIQLFPEPRPRRFRKSGWSPARSLALTSGRR